MSDTGLLRNLHCSLNLYIFPSFVHYSKFENYAKTINPARKLFPPRTEHKSNFVAGTVPMIPLRQCAQSQPKEKKLFSTSQIVTVLFRFSLAPDTMRKAMI